MDRVYCGQITTTKGVYRQYKVVYHTKHDTAGKLGTGLYFDFQSNKRSLLFPTYCGKIPKYITGRILEIDEHLRDFLAKNYKEIGKFLHERKD